MARRPRSASKSPTASEEGATDASGFEEVPGADREDDPTTEQEGVGEETMGGTVLRDPEGDEVSKPATKPTSKAAQPKVQAKTKEPLVPGASAEAARQASPSDFIKAKIPTQYGSATIYGRGGKESVHAGGEVVEMTRAQAERIGAVEVKGKARVEPESTEEE